GTSSIFWMRDVGAVIYGPRGSGIVTYSGRTPYSHSAWLHPDRKIALSATDCQRKRLRDPFLHQRVGVDRYSFSRPDCLLAAALVALPRRQGASPRRPTRRLDHIGQFALCFSR